MIFLEITVWYAESFFDREIDWIFQNLFQTLATAVVQILYACDHTWKKQACGVLCYVKDYSKRAYYFRLYNLKVGDIRVFG